jgi:hypothetical protein
MFDRVSIFYILHKPSNQSLHPLWGSIQVPYSTNLRSSHGLEDVTFVAFSSDWFLLLLQTTRILIPVIGILNMCNENRMVKNNDLRHDICCLPGNLRYRNIVLKARNDLSQCHAVITSIRGPETSMNMKLFWLMICQENTRMVVELDHHN